MAFSYIYTCKGMEFILSGWYSDIKADPLPLNIIWAHILNPLP